MLLYPTVGQIYAYLNMHINLLHPSCSKTFSIPTGYPQAHILQILYKYYLYKLEFIHASTVALFHFSLLAHSLLGQGQGPEVDRKSPNLI